MSRQLILTVVLCLCCIKFESPYEDLNGIYLEWLGSLDAEGTKLVFDGKVGYLAQSSSVSSYSIDGGSIQPERVYMGREPITDLAVRSGYAYLACPSVGLQIVNFTLPNPRLCGELSLSGSIRVQAVGSRAYILDEQNLYVVGVSDREAPAVVGQFAFPASPKSLEVDSVLAHVLLSDDDFWVLDVSDPRAITVKSKIEGDSLPQITWFAVKGSYVYLATSYGEIIVFESRGSNLLETSRLGLPDDIHFLSVDTKYGVALTDENTFYLISLQYPSRPCVSEVLNLPEELVFGVVRANYIYLLSPMNVVEIKEIPK